jgi:hypothetical protein
VSVEVVDEDAEARKAQELRDIVTAHATGRRRETGGSSWKDHVKSEEGATELVDDPEPVDAFSTHNPFGGAYKGVHLDADAAVDPSSTAARAPVLAADDDGGDAEFKKRKRPSGMKMRKRGKLE